ncbi:MAG: nucleotide exchange factor GrpE [Candidatus Muirbacterium halophilum]|nr:nucleotide exchange factor GrpE [Candidatus Muirbacterium halophilum]
MNEEFEAQLKEANEKYIRLAADFENYKKRTNKEKEEIRNNTKIEMLSTILEIDNDISIALNNIQDEGMLLIYKKLEDFLLNNGIKSIQTDTYDENLHDVISVSETEDNKIIVLSKGYTLNDKVIKHAKIILNK